jgi:hypothetical protein
MSNLLLTVRSLIQLFSMHVRCLYDTVNVRTYFSSCTSSMRSQYEEYSDCHQRNVVHQLRK